MSSTILKKHPNPTQNPTSKRHVLTLEERVAVLKYLDSHPNATMSEVCIRFASNPRTLRRIQDKRETLLNLPEGDKRLSRTRFTKGNCQPVELCVLRWMDLAHFNKLNITNLTLQNRAKHFFSLVRNYIPQVPFLAASNGWINRFKVRNSIDLKGLNRESASYFSQKLAPKRAAIQETLSKYSLDDVFVLSTTVLFYSYLPTISNPNPRGSSPKLPPSDRFSLFLCVNATGTQKIFPSVVVPGTFSPENEERLLAGLIKSHSGRIDAESYLSWLDSFHRFVDGRRILLVLDHMLYKYFSGASAASLYPNIEFVFLPQCHSLLLQPFNLGITEVLKTEYRTCLARETLSCTNYISEQAFNSFQISQARAVTLIEQAWSNISTSIIQFSWKASGILPTHLALEFPEQEPSFADPFREFLDSQPQLYSFLGSFDSCDRINCDRDGSFPTEAEILVVEEAVSYLFDLQPSLSEGKIYNCPTVSNENVCPEQLIPGLAFDPTYHEGEGFPYNELDYLTVFPPLPDPPIHEEYQVPFMAKDSFGIPNDSFRPVEPEPFTLVPKSIEVQNVDMLLSLLRNQLCTSFDVPENVTSALDLISQYVHRYDQ